MRSWRFNITSALIAATAAWWIGERDQDHGIAQSSPRGESPLTSDGTTGDSIGKSAGASPGGAASRTPASVPQQRVVVQSVSERVRDSLSTFQRLKRTVLALSGQSAERDAGLKENLFRDQSLMRDLESLLKAPATGDAELAREQMTALDLLFDAMNSKYSNFAESVLTSVIEDRSIEDDTIDPSSRQSMAEVKAEVLYRWSAAQPERAEQLVGLLPGPVSQKIWGNVVDVQSQNAAESQTDHRSRH